ncbi:MAG: ricin-type beta-trefoil lectin domain protein [Helicobacter sp.]|nr:ricin-type beta-trefoil lectin domain protein [Helicobacter sp.]
MRFYPLLFVFFLLMACSSTKDLGIGLTPTPPNESLPRERSGISLMDVEQSRLPILTSKNAPKVDKNASNPLSIMSSSGGLLTLWALNPRNWVWGYTPFDSLEFGQATYWRIISFSGGQVMIKNMAKNTCLEAYKNGVIHDKCDNKNQAQLWNLNFFDNQAIQIQNVGAKTCLQTPTIRTTTYYSIYLTKCAINESNLDQQWYITPVVEESDPIFFIR